MHVFMCLYMYIMPMNELKIMPIHTLKTMH